MKLEILLPGVRKDVLLKDYTTFKIGGPARYFFAAKTKEDVIRAVAAAKKNRVPFFILGAGSNLLVSDKGFPGLVIKFQVADYKVQGLRLCAEAGVPFGVLVREACKYGLAGLEWAGGLPGTIGGAIRGNAGAFGGETKDNIIYVECMDKSGKIRRLTKKQCHFSYRSSIFKKKDWIILSAAFRLRKGKKEDLQAIVVDHINRRLERCPMEYPNAGSIFKNCDFKNIPVAAQKKFKGITKADPFPVVPTAAVLAEAGLKEFRIGAAKVSEKHPNFIVNTGNATARDVVRLIAAVKRAVKKKFGISLEEEIKFVGF